MEYVYSHCNQQLEYVFDEGRVVEDGTHKQLLAKHGFYAGLWKAQVGGFLPDKPVEENDEK